MKTTQLFARFLNLLVFVSFFMFISSCDSKSKKQLQLAEQCVENNEYEEAIKLLSSIKQTSNYYKDARQLSIKAYDGLIMMFYSKDQYNEAALMLDTITSKSPYYEKAQWLLPVTNVSNITVNYLIDKSIMDDKMLETLDQNLNILYYQLDTIAQNSIYYSNTIRILSIASFVKATYYYDAGKYEKSLQQLNIINDKVLDNSIIVKTNDLRKAVTDSINSEKRRQEEEKRKQDIRTIQTLTSNIGDSDYFDSLHNSDDPFDLVSELQEFQEYWRMIDRMSNLYSDDEIVCSQVKKLKAELVRVQKREFPILRKRVAKILSQKLWLDNIDVYCSGNNNTTISFVGFGFASNAYAAKAQDTFELIFKEFKFKKSHYHWYRGSEYISFKIDSSDDSDRVDVYVNTSF